MSREVIYTGVDEDERIHMLDRGIGRDIGLNPTFHGQKPRTRTENHGLPGEKVGGYGSREESVTSFAATAIGISNVSQHVAVGSGAVKGFCFFVLTGSAIIKLRNGGPNGIVLFAATIGSGAGGTACQFFGDHGINYNGLYLDVISATSLDGSVWVASTE